MTKDKVTEIFDQHASTYDQKWSKLAAINHALHLLTSAVLSGLPSSARVLCVGSGTGAEILYLADKFPGWHFTAVEPSKRMMEVFQKRADERGISSRCNFHIGYLDSLPSTGPFDAATAILVSQFITDRCERTDFFRMIADRLVPSGILVSADLSADLSVKSDHPGLLDVWFQLMHESGTLGTAEEIQRMRDAYTNDVSVLPPDEVGDIITRGGFHSPECFYQAGMIRAWYSRRAAADQQV